MNFDFCTYEIWNYHFKLCRWPLCSLQCSQANIHIAECQFLSQVCHLMLMFWRCFHAQITFKAGIDISPEDTDSLYDVITVLRCLYLMKTNQMAWQQLLNLQESNPNELDAELANRAKMVTALICGTFKLGNVFAKVLVSQQKCWIFTHSFFRSLYLTFAPDWTSILLRYHYLQHVPLCRGSIVWHVWWNTVVFQQGTGINRLQFQIYLDVM